MSERSSQPAIRTLQQLFLSTVKHFGHEVINVADVPDLDGTRRCLAVRLRGRPVGVRYGDPMDLSPFAYNTTYGMATLVVEMVSQNPYRNPDWEIMGGVFGDRPDIRIQRCPTAYSLHLPVTTVVAFLLSQIDERLSEAVQHQQQAHEFEQMMKDLGYVPPPRKPLLLSIKTGPPPLNAPQAGPISLPGRSDKS